MKILHVIPVYLPYWQFGGPVRSTHAIATAVQRKGHEVRVITTSIGTPHAGNREPIEISVDEIPVVYCPGSIGIEGIRSNILAERVTSELAAGIDLVHVTGVWQPSVIAVCRHLHRTSTPYVSSPRGSLSRYSFAHSPLKKWCYFHLFEARIQQRAAIVHATAEIERRDLRGLGIRSGIRICPNIVDSSIWGEDVAAADALRRTLGIAGHEFVVAHIGRVHPKKNLLFLASAMKQLAASRRARLLLVGPVAAEDKKYLHNVMAALPANDVIHLPGTGDVRDLRVAYSAADLLALPSHSENFGNTVVEALLCGTPVAASSEVGAALFMVGSPGNTVLPLDRNCWRRFLEQQIAAGSRRRVPESTRQHAARYFGPERIGAEMELMYHDAVMLSRRAQSG